ncbi:hypothetical protein EJP77_14165 [Paenibacillus zeisoli]|uniref:Uncharacterized protein n=1 Tax=Paenibacillus zeisoli TaxID=2496267 RepID=A0A3S1D7M0_9BACL|nr:hypothetical protein [Paenibacillus zeisoli]RUT29521.1 hypothetical protein EJP77_14165 [Paenibacillus zeisoli]
MMRQSKWKNVIYMLIALAMLIYALPMISFKPGAGWVSVFGMVWAAFAFLIIGAHLHFLLGVDAEKQRALDQIRKAKLMDWQRKWAGEKKESQGL